VDFQAADGSLFCGGKSVYLCDSTVPYAHAISHCLERWQSYEEFSVAILLDAFESAAEPPERSVVEIEPALAERGRIHPFPA
jgi:hypothetical protein